MGVVVSRRGRDVRVLWNGREEIVEVRRKGSSYIFRLRNGREIRTDNRHLVSVVEKRLSKGRRNEGAG